MLRRMTIFMAGLCCGVAVGAVITLLLTPDSGQNLRLQSRQLVQNLLQESTRAAEERRQQLRTQLAQKIKT